MPTMIEWVRNPDGSPGESWNPITGCSPESDGCTNCYASRQIRSGRTPAVHGSTDFGKVTFHPSRLDVPLHWKKPRRVFVCSMGDLFHEHVKDNVRDEIFKIIRQADQHTFMVLTKRPERMKEWFAEGAFHYFNPAGCGCYCHDDEGDTNIDGGCENCERVHTWPLPNLWLGVTVEGPETMWRRAVLAATPAALRFISFEPLLADPGEVDLSGISWVIVGGETGPGARAMKYGWPTSLLRQCRSVGIPFFFKGWGTHHMKKSDPEYMVLGTFNRREWKEFPDPPIVRELSVDDSARPKDAEKKEKT